MAFGACLGRSAVVLRVAVLLGYIVKVLVAAQRCLQVAGLFVRLAEHVARLALQLADLAF